MEKDGALPQYSELPPPYTNPASSAPPEDLMAPRTIVPPPSYFAEQNSINNPKPAPFSTPRHEQAQIIIQQPTGTTVHVVSNYPPVGRNPKSLVCGHCGRTVTTRIVKQSDMRAHILAISFCLVGFWPCVPFVYLMDCYTTTSHYCPSCNACLGVHVRTLH